MIRRSPALAALAALACAAAAAVTALTGAASADARADASAARADTAAAPSSPVSIAADPLLSRNKPVTASSSGGCCAPRNAVDGNSATRWASGAGRDPQWIYVDLGASAHVSRVRLQWDASCARAYRVETSADHGTWTPISSTSTGDGGVDDLTVDGTGRYVRMYGTQRCRSDASHGYSLQEFDVYGTTGQADREPPTAPGPPTLVSVTSTSATIRWGASTDDVGVTGVRRLPRRPELRHRRREHVDGHLHRADPEPDVRVLRQRA